MPLLTNSATSCWISSRVRRRCPDIFCFLFIQPLHHTRFPSKRCVAQTFTLESCRCVIPALKLEATSINHAFTLISEAYETKRLSHTGNVFERAYTPVGPKRWQTLDDLRIKAIAQSLQGKLEFPASKDGKK